MLAKRTTKSHPWTAVAALAMSTTHAMQNERVSLPTCGETPKQLMWKVLGVALLLLENICPISLPEADNNAKPQILRTRPHPPPRSSETEVAAEIQGRKRRGKGAVIILNARPSGRSEVPLSGT